MGMKYQSPELDQSAYFGCSGLFLCFGKSPHIWPKCLNRPQAVNDCRTMVLNDLSLY